MRLKDSVGGSALLTSGVARPASLTPTDTAASVDELRQKLAGWHFAKESLTDGEREILAVAEAVLAELDRRDADGYAR